MRCGVAASCAWMHKSIYSRRTGGTSIGGWGAEFAGEEPLAIKAPGSGKDRRSLEDGNKRSDLVITGRNLGNRTGAFEAAEYVGAFEAATTAEELRNERLRGCVWLQGWS